MRKTFVPGTFIVGQRGFITTTQVVQEPIRKLDGGVTMQKIKKKVRFPFYRGMSAKLANHIRGQVKRQNRLAEEKLIQEILDA